ncbi:MAG TPA: glycerophosphodiester phosphodiesterase [Gemmatimonadales bacterium]|nr:glycerophosphodiester phosphodiesterase [Gemmatimonadales bacterium]
MSRPLIIAHRGASGYQVENSLAAFRAAGELGADAVELDIHSTADGALVVHHAETIGDHHIAHLALDDVRAHPLANGEGIPTLREALEVILPRMIAYVEIKYVAKAADERLFDVIEHSGAPNRIALHSFDHRIIRRMGEKRPFIRRGVLSASYPVYPVRSLEDADASILWQHHQHVDDALVASVHGAGKTVYVWTVNDPAEVRRFLALGVDGICTDFPDVARAAFASVPA